ncbi:delta-class carbonic anhydrase [uncultured Cohaesibacter sp.]|uniref:delta-class carbonic anhydrase n=1 Tax=uncultured Cohaesibacter sp. TaxID=1002546 RepID=UPI0029C88C24|nr:delta-class carbonic anhydrase [uncultured Cohaesibacter sp.]
MTKNISLMVAAACLFTLSGAAWAGDQSFKAVSDDVINAQRAALAESAKDAGYGPQAPRDLDALDGTNMRLFSRAPSYKQMNLCNIHFHKNAEHKGGDFTTYAGNGDGEGYGSGWKYNDADKLSKDELAVFDHGVGETEHSPLATLYPGDTIEVHYVYSTAQVKPGPTLNSCFNETIKNPQLRVEGQVFVLVNDSDAADFLDLVEVEQENGLYQAPGLPTNSGEPIQYEGSTTGPGYNEVPSPFQVSWGVRPRVLKVNIASVEKWLEGNVFEEDHAHGVRNLVINPELLSQMQ